MRACGATMRVGSGSRLSALSDAIESVNRTDERVLREIVQRAADPRDFATELGRHVAVVAHLNQFLRFDGFELQQHGAQMRLVQAGTTLSVTTSLAAAAAVVDFDTVRHDLERALANADTDPEDAVTSACSILESVCRSILVELGLPLPDKKDIQTLYRAVREPLRLAPDKAVAPDLIADDVRSILNGLGTVVHGVGALRTHGGDAHGRERGRARVIDPRIARLAIHSASGLAVFLLETWRFRYPATVLRRH